MHTHNTHTYTYTYVCVYSPLQAPGAALPPVDQQERNAASSKCSGTRQKPFLFSSVRKVQSVGKCTVSQ